MEDVRPVLVDIDSAHPFSSAISAQFSAAFNDKDFLARASELIGQHRVK
jgi:hypothetical protein